MAAKSFMSAMKHGTFDHPLQAGAGRLEHRPQVLEDLPGLSLDAPIVQGSVGAEGDLASREDQLSGADGLRIGTEGGGRRIAMDSLFHDITLPDRGQATGGVRWRHHLPHRG